MRLLFVLPAYEPAWPLGGVVRCMANLCRGLVRAGHSVAVYTLNTDGKGGELSYPCDIPVDQGGVQVYYHRSTFGSKSLFDSRSLIRRLYVNVENFDLVYVSAIWQLIGVNTINICSKRNIPCIVGAHGSFDQLHWRHHRLKKDIYWHLFLSKAVQKCSSIHYTTIYEQKQSNWRGKFNSFVLNNGFDMSLFYYHLEERSDLRYAMGIPDDDIVAIIVGRPDPKKGVELAIRALVHEVRAWLLFVGDAMDPIVASWKTLASDLGVSDRVVWTGFLEGDALSAAYSAADVLLLPSEDENFGMVVIEAMACGLPVLVTEQVGVWGEIAAYDVGQTILRDPNDIAAKLGDVVEHEEMWKQRGQKAVQVAHGLFDIDRTSLLMAQVFSEITLNRRLK